MTHEIYSSFLVLFSSRMSYTQLRWAYLQCKSPVVSKLGLAKPFLCSLLQIPCSSQHVSESHSHHSFRAGAGKIGPSTGIRVHSAFSSVFAMDTCDDVTKLSAILSVIYLHRNLEVSMVHSENNYDISIGRVL